MNKKTENYRPEYRLLARLLDITIFQIIVIFIIATTDLLFDFNILGIILLNDGELKYRYYFLILYLYTFVEALMLSTWGTTPGKRILKIKLRTKAGKKLSYWKALVRSHYVWLVGMGAGILAPITVFLAYFRLEKYGTTDWDRSLKLKVKVKTVSIWIVLLVFAITIVL